MAEQSKKNKRFLKGLFKDTAHIDQPEGTWRYARNAIINEKKGSISNEGGAEQNVSIDNNDTVIGIIEVANDKAIIFYITNTGESAIGKWENDQFQVVYTPLTAVHGIKVNLNFNKNFPIEGTFNINPEGELIVYWTDDLNPPRALNIDKQLNSGSSLNNLYGINPVNSHDNHIDLLNLFPNSGPVPHIDLLEISQGPSTYQNAVKEGGGLLTGVYYLSLAYVDDSYTATNYLTMSNPISIVDEGDHTRPTTKKDGAKSGSQTSKSITWNITNLNDDYKYLRPVIIRKMGEAVDAYRLNDLEIVLGASDMNVTFSGIEGFSSTSLEDVIIDTISYETAKTINQLDGILYIGNTTSRDDLGYQKYANNIKLTAVTKDFNNFDVNVLTVDNLQTGFNSYPVDVIGNTPPTQVNVDHSKSYRYAPNIFKYKGYMRDEVYAFYIAFILNDGSMSYAYHIPGREATGDDKDLLPTDGWFKDFEKISPSYIRKFHLYDFSDHDLVNYSYDNRNMNYWENATEVYPSTDNFEVWDGITQQASLKGLNVRHHHFPSNGNPTHKTIHDNESLVTKSQGTEDNVKDWASDSLSGSTTARISFAGDDTVGEISCSTFKTCVFGSPNVTATQTNPTLYPDMMDTLWKSNRYFVADQPMIVKAAWRVYIELDNPGGSGSQHGYVQLVKEANGVISPINSDSFSETANTSDDCHICEESAWSNAVTLMPGDRMYLRTWSNGSSCLSHSVKHMSDCSSNNYIEFHVTTGEGLYEEDDLHDVKLSHDVKALGFKLDDIKIPGDIANKVQGFRIYRAKRKHEDKRILGQSLILPMFPETVQLGLCDVAASNADSAQILSAAMAKRQNIWSKDSWPRAYHHYPVYPSMYNYNPNTDLWDDALHGEKGYKSFSFHDFNLLRTQNSLAGATHIKPEYWVRNFAWNGPTLYQPKKMLSKIIEDDGGGNYSEPIKKIEQFWGWDEPYNCYARDIKSAMFSGCFYTACNSLKYFDESTNDIVHHKAAPRLLGQKAKSYIPGDSIFEVSALGFGGKVANEFGESAIILGLKDNHEILNYNMFNYRGGDAGVSGLSSDVLGTWGHSHLNHPWILTNPLLNDNDPYINYAYNSDEEVNQRRSQSIMANLHAFKTDVYKSIDNQELVWTGFEVLGDELNNFIFKSNGDPASYDGGSANFSTERINSEGIFGGDTYICRYGFRSTIQHNNTDEDSHPRRAIYYHIVESTDNINFRHTESDKDLYFPGSIAKRMIQANGEDDFTHQDNLNYDDSFSAENDLRPAFPLPLKEIEQTEFPTRAHRSVKRDTTSLTDNYRLFLANEFKDAPKNRGELWKLSSFNNLLYFHMEESLYVTKGKQQMQMKDGTEAFVGSGDIFQQDPDEIMQTDKGYGGTQSQWATATTNYGYFFIDRNAKKVFLMKDKLNEISTAGMENWFENNLTFALEAYSFNASCISIIFDNPVIGLGLTAIYDPKFKRIILTKKDLIPTSDFITGWNEYLSTIAQAGSTWQGGEIFFDCDVGQYVTVIVNDNPGGPNTFTFDPLDWDDDTYFTPKGWTISYYPEFNVWCGFHDYTPYIYFNTSKDFYSITDQSNYIWKHNSDSRGNFYGEVSPFEIEYIHNEYREEDTLLASFNYTLETFNPQNISVLEHGFTSFFVYNTLQISAGELDGSRAVAPTALEYLVNIRRVGNNWKVNNFRDMAAIAIDTSSYYMAGTITNPNIIGGINTGTITTSSTNNMFIVDGMSEIINPSYIDTAKEWQNRRKFIDKWAGIRLIYNNISNNLLNLYSGEAAVRKTYK